MRKNNENSQMAILGILILIVVIFVAAKYLLDVDLIAEIATFLNQIVDSIRNAIGTT
jgi:hypothetical protein